MTGPQQKLQEILQIESEAEFQKKYANTPILRAKRQGFLRNACVVAANQKSFSLIPLLEQRAQDSNILVAQHATWAVQKLRRQ